MKNKISEFKAKSTEKVIGSFAQALEKYYTSWGNLMARSFVGGLFTALGATVGLALVLTLFGFILDWLGVLPVVGSFFARINAVIGHALPSIK